MRVRLVDPAQRVLGHRMRELDNAVRPDGQDAGHTRPQRVLLLALDVQTMGAFGHSAQNR